MCTEPGANILAGLGTLPAYQNEKTIDTLVNVEGMPEGFREAIAADNFVLECQMIPQAGALEQIIAEEHDLIMIGEEDKNAVLNWQKSGNLFVIATGRNLGTIKPIFESYGFSPDFWILNNGAMIADRDGKTLFTKLIPRETALAVLRYLQSINDDGSGVSLTDRKVCLLSEKGTSTQKACDGGTITADQLESLDNIVQIHRRNLDLKHIKDLCKDIEERFSEVSAYANLWNGDIVARGVDKAVAVKWLKEHFPQIEKIRCIGDSVNDLGMVRAYQGAVPDVADPEIKKEATQIVKSVAEFLENF